MDSEISIPPPKNFELRTFHGSAKMGKEDMGHSYSGYLDGGVSENSYVKSWQS